jgi:hypothetical protein
VAPRFFTTSICRPAFRQRPTPPLASAWSPCALDRSVQEIFRSPGLTTRPMARCDLTLTLQGITGTAPGPDGIAKIIQRYRKEWPKFPY